MSYYIERILSSDEPEEIVSELEPRELAELAYGLEQYAGSLPYNSHKRVPPASLEERVYWLLDLIEINGASSNSLTSDQQLQALHADIGVWKSNEGDSAISVGAGFKLGNAETRENGAYLLSLPKEREKFIRMQHFIRNGLKLDPDSAEAQNITYELERLLSRPLEQISFNGRVIGYSSDLIGYYIEEEAADIYFHPRLAEYLRVEGIKEPVKIENRRNSHVFLYEFIDKHLNCGFSPANISKIKTYLAYLADNPELEIVLQDGNIIKSKVAVSAYEEKMTVDCRIAAHVVQHLELAVPLAHYNKLFAKTHNYGDLLTPRQALRKIIGREPLYAEVKAFEDDIVTIRVGASNSEVGGRNIKVSDILHVGMNIKSKGNRIFVSESGVDLLSAIYHNSFESDILSDEQGRPAISTFRYAATKYPPTQTIHNRARRYNDFLVRLIEEQPELLVSENPNVTLKQATKIVEIEGIGRVALISAVAESYLSSFAFVYQEPERESWLTTTEILEQFGLENNNANNDILQKIFHTLFERGDEAFASGLTTRQEIKYADVVARGVRGNHSRMLFRPDIIGEASEFALVTKEAILEKRRVQFTRNDAWNGIQDKHGNDLVAAAEFIREKFPNSKQKIIKARDFSMEIQALAQRQPDKIVCTDPELTLDEATRFIETEEYGLVAFFSPLAEQYFADLFDKNLSQSVHEFVKGEEIISLLGIPKKKEDSTYPVMAVQQLIEEIFQSRKPDFVVLEGERIDFDDFIKQGKKSTNSGIYIRKDVLLHAEPKLLTKEKVEQRIRDLYLKEHPTLTLNGAIQLVKGVGAKVSENDEANFREFIFARLNDSPAALLEDGVSLNDAVELDSNGAIKSIGSQAIGYLRQHLYRDLPASGEWIAGDTSIGRIGLSKQYISSFNSLVRKLWLKSPDSEVEIGDNQVVKVSDVVGHFRRGNVVGLLFNDDYLNRVITEKQIRIDHEGTEDVATKLPESRANWVMGAVELAANLHISRSGAYIAAINELMQEAYAKRNHTLIEFKGKDGVVVQAKLSDYIDRHISAWNNNIAVDPVILGDETKPPVISAYMITKRTLEKQGLPPPLSPEKNDWIYGKKLLSPDILGMGPSSKNIAALKRYLTIKLIQVDGQDSVDVEGEQLKPDNLIGKFTIMGKEHICINPKYIGSFIKREGVVAEVHRPSDIDYSQRIRPLDFGEESKPKKLMAI